jgi:hypothetical protein
MLCLNIGLILFIDHYYDINKLFKKPQSSPPAATSNPGALSDFQESSYLSSPYTYKRDGKIVIAMFGKKFLPGEEAILLGAAGAVIKQGFGEDTNRAGSLLDYSNKKTITMKSVKHTFAVVAVKEETGEINSLWIDCLDC